MNNTQLNELGWFSFTQDQTKLRQFTIFQAVAYILRNEKDLVLLGDEYERLLHRLETESAEEIYAVYGETAGQYSASTEVREIDYEEICIPESEIMEEVTLLNDNRTALTEDMGTPISIIYSLLQSEINKYKSNKRTILKIMTKNIGGVDYFHFNKKELSDWKSLSAIKDLGLLDIDLINASEPRLRKLKNQKKATGMLIYLLAELSLKSDDRRMKFTKKADVTNVNYSGIYSYFKDNYVDEFTKFPSENTITTYLKASYEQFIESTFPEK